MMEKEFSKMDLSAELDALVEGDDNIAGLKRIKNIENVAETLGMKTTCEVRVGGQLATFTKIMIIHTMNHGTVVFRPLGSMFIKLGYTSTACLRYDSKVAKNLMLCKLLSVIDQYEGAPSLVKFADTI